MARANTTWCLSYVLLFVVYFRLVRRCFPEPYMDEYFHVRQTLQYVTKHDFGTWDPKITTPPGLYLVGLVVSKLFGTSLPVLRSVNLISILVTLLWPLARPLSRSRPGSQNRLKTMEIALLVCGLPILALYGSLYYTDVLSTLLVLRGMYAASPEESSFVFFLSLWFRQTNIVWAGAAAAIRIIGSQHVDAVFTNLAPLLKRSLRIAPAYLTVLGLFVGFLKWNGSVALGDKSNHEVSLHYAQALYFLLFFSLLSAPLMFLSILRGGKNRLMQLFGNTHWIPLELAVIYGIIKYGTVVHPFILSDNRHFTFYIWRRFITPCEGLMIIPIYWVAWRWFAATLNFQLLKTWVVIAAVLAVLIPSPLMEPRYYIVPYLVWRLQLYAEPAHSLEYAWNAIMNCATMYIFCFSKTHFMW